MAIKIFIDQGHNPQGINAGAEGFGLREQDITYNVGIYLRDILEQDPRFEARVSRPTDSTVLGTSNATSLAARVNAANAWPADYFLSIHTNANTNPGVNGTEMYIYSAGGQAQWLAEALLSSVTTRLGTKNNGVFVRPSLFVLRRTAMPAVLLELAYITNEEDAEKLETEQYAFAYAIYQGLLSYFGFNNI
ncbi:MAG: N-acetylmuramoyl-L-alanine amidase [Oscillospiraceae bacterium]|nr:N-acetylmuramoyl-L-alanine amidase [Oscillospiraceae bacterium]